MPHSPTIFFEDIREGEERRFGGHTITEVEILEFAECYDPQYFHIDPEAAKFSHFGGLIASGWHTASLSMRMIVDHFLEQTASMGSPGVDELRWLVPVRPGDTLAVHVRVDEARPSKSKPDRGLVRTSYTTINQRNEAVMTMKAAGFFERRRP